MFSFQFTFLKDKMKRLTRKEIKKNTNKTSMIIAYLIIFYIIGIT